MSQLEVPQCTNSGIWYSFGSAAPLGLTYKVPVLRTAHVDKPALERIRRRFTFEDMMRPNTITKEAAV